MPKLSEDQSLLETAYERTQKFNPIVGWLHSRRYKHILGIVDRVARARPGHKIRIVEIGCAHAKLFSVLQPRFDIEYVGVDINPEFIATAEQRYRSFENFRVVLGGAEQQIDLMRGADLVVALETLEHIPEHVVVRILEAVSAARPRSFVCSVPVEIGPSLWLKNVGSFLLGYMRHTEYSWRETFWAGLYQLDKLPPHGTGHKGFDWRWLAQTIRHNLRIAEIRNLPVRWLPSIVSTSVFFVAEPRDVP